MARTTADADALQTQNGLPELFLLAVTIWATTNVLCDAHAKARYPWASAGSFCAYVTPVSVGQRPDKIIRTSKEFDAARMDILAITRTTEDLHLNSA